LASIVPKPLPLPGMVPLPSDMMAQVGGVGRGRKRPLVGGQVARVPKQARGPPTPRAAAGAVSAENGAGAVIEGTAEAAAKWLSRKGPSRRQMAAAKIAEAYFQPEKAREKTDERKAGDSEAPPVKRQRADVAPVTFTAELLSKAPASLQTCRSLLMFLTKKLEEKPAEPPAAKGPAALCSRLEAHCTLAARLAALMEKSGWDARAKRVLDLGAAAKSPSGEAALNTVREKLESERKKLAADVKAGGENGDFEALFAERQAWDQAQFKRGWLAWCAHVLKVQESKLLAEAGGKDPSGSNSVIGKEFGAVDVLHALLEGKLPPMTS